jgi:hypothetical protein
LKDNGDVAEIVTGSLKERLSTVTAPFPAALNLEGLFMAWRFPPASVAVIADEEEIVIADCPIERPTEITRASADGKGKGKRRKNSTVNENRRFRSMKQPPFILFYRRGNHGESQHTKNSSKGKDAFSYLFTNEFFPGRLPNMGKGTLR